MVSQDRVGADSIPNETSSEWASWAKATESTFVSKAADTGLTNDPKNVAGVAESNAPSASSPASGGESARHLPWGSPPNLGGPAAVPAEDAGQGSEHVQPFAELTMTAAAVVGAETREVGIGSPPSGALEAQARQQARFDSASTAVTPEETNPTYATRLWGRDTTDATSNRDADPGDRDLDSSGDLSLSQLPASPSSILARRRALPASDDSELRVTDRQSALASPTPASPNGLPAQGRTPSNETTPDKLEAQAAATPDTAPSDVNPPVQIKTLEIRVQSDQATQIGLRFTERQGKVDVQFRSTDDGAVHSMSTGLNGLKTVLGETGWDVESLTHASTAALKAPVDVGFRSGTQENEGGSTVTPGERLSSEIADPRAGASSVTLDGSHLIRTAGAPFPGTTHSGDQTSQHDRNSGRQQGGSADSRNPQHHKNSNQQDASRDDHGKQTAADFWPNAIEDASTTTPGGIVFRKA
jgi:hypothetical protein